MSPPNVTCAMSPNNQSMPMIAAIVNSMIVSVPD